MSLSIFEGDNIGSIALLEIAAHTDFTGFNPALFASGKDWQIIELGNEAGELKRVSEETEHGILYTYGGGFNVHRIRQEAEAALLPFVGQKAILRITDSNGFVSIIGEPGNPVTLKEESSSGQRYASRNGYSFSFQVSMIQPAYAV